MRNFGFASLLLFAGLAACGDNNSTPPADMSMVVPGDMAGGCNSDLGAPSPSVCGRPCDEPVNALGIGKFCRTNADCMGNGMATFCTSTVNSGGAEDSYFCTVATICDPMNPAAACGPNTSCQCRAIGCGCVPDRCVPMPQG